MCEELERVSCRSADAEFTNEYYANQKPTRGWRSGLFPGKGLDVELYIHISLYF